MDQVKIGKFIAERRKSISLTQMQLGEKLSVTDRAVSKWETGKAMPDSSIMLELCDILQINVNDLLCGEIIMKDEYDKEIEKKLIELIKEKEENDKRLLSLEVVVGVLSVIVLFIPIIIASYLSMEDWQRVVLIFSGFIPAIFGFAVAIKIEQVAGYYKCQHCNHTYVPALNDMYKSMHMGRTRYMKCPKCEKKSWQKKVVEKN